MVIGCCVKCKYIDLIDDNIENSCLRCSGKMVSLGIKSDEWNKISDEDRQALIDNTVSEFNASNNSTDNTSIPDDYIPEEDDKTQDYTDSIDNCKSSNNANSDNSEWSYNFEQKETVASLPSVERNTSGDSIIPSVKKQDASINKPPQNIRDNDPVQVVKSTSGKRIKAVSTKPNTDNNIHIQSSVNQNYNMMGADGGTRIIRILAVVIASIFVVICLLRSSSLGGLAAIASIVIPFRTTFMNGYDMFEDTHISIRYIVWSVLIIISLVGVITSA